VDTKKKEAHPMLQPEARSTQDDRTGSATAQDDGRTSAEALRIPRRYTKPGVHPYDEVEWEQRDAVISSGSDVAFEQKGVEVPKSWSQLATNVVAQKYFRGQLGTPQRESSVRQLIDRVVKTATEWGREGRYFASEEDAQAFEAELTHLLLHQMVSFNSPVWFNCGVEAHPQVSACFINSVQDTMQSILELAKTEGMLFKYGSGTGSNLSTIRSSREQLAGGGTASGPVSFMRGYDAFAGVIKSGGKTRRAAKMVILNVDHPDVPDFIESKAEEEKKAWALIESGYSGEFNVPGGAYDSVFFQNANHSVRVTDEFMRAVMQDGEWQTKAVVSKKTMETLRARDLMKKMAEAAWVCGDPGIQFDTTVNAWHPCPNTSRINASNPCVTGDTRVATSEGWQRIDALVGKTAKVIGADGLPHVVTEIFPTGRKLVYLLRTKAGYEVRLTGNHKVWTQERGDVPVEDLKVGEHVELQGAGFGRRAMSERLAIGIGAAVGDGCLTRSYQGNQVQEIVILTMGAEEAEVVEAITGGVNEAKAELRAVGISGHPGPVAMRVAVGTGGRVSRVSFSSQAVVDVFKEFAVLDGGSAAKRFTDAVYELDEPTLAAMLRGLFTADGTVADYGDKSQYVSLDSTSLELLRQVQVLLLSFGIKSKLYTERRGGATESMLPDGKGGMKSYAVQEMHSLRISRSSRLVFERRIGFHPASPKVAALARLNERVEAYLDAMSDPIASVEAAGEEDVFDLTEPATHHFVANGLTVHNCSEYMFLDDSACNLASLNLMKFRRPDGEFDPESFKHAVNVTISAMEIWVDNASYPTKAIEKNSHDYRPLGLGFANLGALLMQRGLPYDSDAGRAYAASITALMCGQAYTQSAQLAKAVGPFAGYERNREPFLQVMRKHQAAADGIDPELVPGDLLTAARGSWADAITLGAEAGYRNGQATVLAPTGTIAFMMDCDTTGIEPDIALVKYKKLVGGGVFKIVNNTVPPALKKLGYDTPTIQRILDHINETGTIEGSADLKAEHLPIFDCAFKPARGERTIHYMGHVKMMAAVQPFLSGAISKTVNMPSDVTVEEIEQTYLEAWRLGLKAIAIYRDGCKRTQPLGTSEDKKPATSASTAGAAAVAAATATPRRKKLPDTRHSVTHKFSVAGHEGYITVGLFDDGKPGEIFITLGKAGSTLAGFADAWATTISFALQHGVDLRFLVDKFSHVRFEPSGFTGNQDIPIAKSIVDYVFRWLALQFLPKEDQPAKAAVSTAANHSDFNGGAEMEAEDAAKREAAAALAERERRVFIAQADAPPCFECGEIMVRNAACYVCVNCGATSGCS
jgi:ribonucleoside-diphosphate reductase alpha chain